jgi:lysophospholipase L1-like esterase
MTKFWRRKPHPNSRERFFEFVERPNRHERWFKRAIGCATLLAIVLPLVALPQGRYLVDEAASRARKAGRAALAQPIPRAEFDQDWQRFRLRGIAESRRRLGEIYDSTEPAYQALMRYAGLDPQQGLLRWGNYDQTLLLPSTVFEPDDNGRSYRMRRCTGSIWLREVTIQSGVLAFFLVPDRPELRDVIKGTPAIPVEESKQSTNSWGLRGQEPDLDAPVRGIVLGDSFMQGLFVDDEHTPPECLRKDLEARLKTGVSVLNAGVLGYSPEQYYYSLVAFADRFQPQFVVVSVFANDFGEASEVTKGGGDWYEGKYWLDRILSLTQSRGWTCLFVPVPVVDRTLGRRKSGFYPGAISNILNTSAVVFLNPAEAFVNAHLRLLIEAEERGERPSGCLLYNEKISDGHFSALGAQVWAEAVGRRLALLIGTKNQR